MSSSDKQTAPLVQMYREVKSDIMDFRQELVTYDEANEKIELDRDREIFKNFSNGYRNQIIQDLKNTDIFKEVQINKEKQKSFFYKLKKAFGLV